MKKSSKRSQARHTTRSKAARLETSKAVEAKTGQEFSSMGSSLEIRAANAGLLPPTAADLAIIVENGEGAEALAARIQGLPQRDFIDVRRAIQTVDRALNHYALSWR